jgi:hypothetical protein
MNLSSMIDSDIALRIGSFYIKILFVPSLVGISLFQRKLETKHLDVNSLLIQLASELPLLTGT